MARDTAAWLLDGWVSLLHSDLLNSRYWKVEKTPQGTHYVLLLGDDIYWASQSVNECFPTGQSSTSTNQDDYELLSTPVRQSVSRNEFAEQASYRAPGLAL